MDNKNTEYQLKMMSETLNYVYGELKVAKCMLHQLRQENNRLTHLVNLLEEELKDTGVC